MKYVVAMCGGVECSLEFSADVSEKEAERFVKEHTDGLVRHVDHIPDPYRHLTINSDDIWEFDNA